MLEIVLSNQFKKDLKQAQKRNCRIDLLKEVVNTLASQQTLPAKHRDHSLIGKYAGFRECHIEPDWLLIYRIRDEDWSCSSSVPEATRICSKESI